MVTHTWIRSLIAMPTELFRSIKNQTMIESPMSAQSTYKRNLEARYFNDCFRGKAISITYAECVSVALVILHAKGMRRFIICELCVSIIFFHVTS